MPVCIELLIEFVRNEFPSCFLAVSFTFEPKVTSAAAVPTFGTDSSTVTSLPSKVSWLTEIGDTFTFTPRPTSSLPPFGVPAATTAMATPKDSHSERINSRYSFNDRL